MLLYAFIYALERYIKFVDRMLRQSVVCDFLPLNFGFERWRLSLEYKYYDVDDVIAATRGGREEIQGREHANKHHSRMRTRRLASLVIINLVSCSISQSVKLVSSRLYVEELSYKIRELNRNVHNIHTALDA